MGADSELEELKSASNLLADEAREQIATRYQVGDSRPWILGFSGGKDSTLVAQLLFEALLRVPPRRRTRPVFILSSDTQVETPYIIDFMSRNLALMSEAALSLGLPIQTKLVSPALNDTFWVRLIGYGYPPPSKFMRWCTDRLKIKPANRFILETISSHGEVVLLLGARYQESAQRTRSLRRHDRGDGFYRHSTMPNAYVWAPILKFATDQVWAYLVFHASPWGGDNRALRDLYRNASAGECPLVVDETTEPCGNSRFGCYVCTVVERDKSLEGFVVGGMDEYRELLEFRNWLIELRDKPEYRETARRNGDAGIGPLTLQARQQVLERVLAMQVHLGEELISPQEIAVIKQAWLADGLRTMATAAP